MYTENLVKRDRYMAPLGGRDPKMVVWDTETKANFTLKPDFAVDTLMVYHHAKNLPILSRNKKEAFFLFLRTHTNTQTSR